MNTKLKEYEKMKEVTEAEEKNLIRKAVELCDKVERHQQWNLLPEVNALRTRGREKRKAFEEIVFNIEQIQTKLKMDRMALDMFID